VCERVRIRDPYSSFTLTSKGEIFKNMMILLEIPIKMVYLKFCIAMQKCILKVFFYIKLLTLGTKK
jgi:hypothetical protein